MSKIWLSKPHMGGQEYKYIDEAFQSNWIAPLGANVDGFENDLENFLQEDSFVATVNSGTAALHLALILLGIKKNDLVLCQSLTFAATVNPVLYQGAIPVFVDSEIDTWNLDPNYLEDAIKQNIKSNKKPKAIIGVDIYGMPYKVDEIKYISTKYEIPIIEDAAEALGSAFRHKKCGTLGDLSVLSFNGNKIITTSGGGALRLESEILKKEAIFLSSQARDSAIHYQHSKVGYNYRLSNVCAGIGRGQMEVLNDRIQQRRENFKFYKELFKEFEGIGFHEEPNDDYFSNHWLTSITVDSSKTGFTSEDLRSFLYAHDIESVPVWKPLHLQPVFKKYPFFGAKVAENLFNVGLCLPSSSNLSDLEKNKIAEVISKFK